jgi:peptide/nickel transport system ATP-binding protein
MDALYDNPLPPYALTLLSAIPIPTRRSSGRGRPFACSGHPEPGESLAAAFQTRCPFVQPTRYHEEEPLLRPVDGHLVACHFAERVRSSEIQHVERAPVFDATLDESHQPLPLEPPPT